jgi:hypothetical protein
VRSIRRLMLQLADDLGDLSIVEARDKGRESVHAAETFIADASDALTDMEHKLSQLQAELQKRSQP